MLSRGFFVCFRHLCASREADCVYSFHAVNMPLAVLDLSFASLSSLWHIVSHFASVEAYLNFLIVATIHRVCQAVRLGVLVVASSRILGTQLRCKPKDVRACVNE